MLDEKTARQYSAAWARNVRSNERVQEGSGGDFFGQLGSLGFDYSAQNHTLTVRTYIFPYSTAFASETDLVPWLNGIIGQQKNPPFDGVFETLTPRWEPEAEPSLFLRVDIKEDGETNRAIISRLKTLRENGLLWRRARLTDALDALVKKSRQEKKTNPT